MLEAFPEYGALRQMDKLTGSQARMARAALAWSVRQLAQKCSISESSIRRIEAEFGVPEKVSLETLLSLKEFYEGRGFRFFRDDGGPGVQWRRRDRRTGADRRGGGSGDVEAARLGPDGFPDVTWLG